MNNQKKKNSKSLELFDQLLNKIEFRDKKPVYINLSNNDFTAKGVIESKIECVKTDKDLMLYYVLCRYTGKTIVFVNSIDAIRRLVPILSFLRGNVIGLHADLQQKQRIKNLESFSAAEDAVLIASDVAARGLDIPQVDHVIHYQLPRAADIYIHRAGRTARGKDNEGISVMLCSPQEQSLYKKLCFALKKGFAESNIENGLPDFPVDVALLDSLKKRLTIARQLDQLIHKSKKEKNDHDWFKKAAMETDIYLSESSDDEGKSHLDKKNSLKILKMKSELASLLSKPLIPRGHSTKYLTSQPDLADIVMRNTSNF